MRMKMGFIGLLIAVVALNILPAYAKDYSGYVETTNYEWSGLFNEKHVVIQGGAAEWWIRSHALTNKEAFPLSNSIVVGKIVQLSYIDSSGNEVTTTDPTVIAQYTRFENGKDMWQDGYVIKVGTVKPGASKNFWLKQWVASDARVIHYEWSTWYRP